MVWKRIENGWQHLRGRAKVCWGRITDTQLDLIAGRRELLVRRVQEHYGLKKGEAENQVDHFAQSFSEADFTPKSEGVTMKNRTLSLIAAAGLAVTGCAATTANRTHETTGEYLDNTVLTTKVKAAFLNEPGLKSFQINVTSFKDVVQLSGFVDSAQSANLAGKVAAGVVGVASVKNDLIIK